METAYTTFTRKVPKLLKSHGGDERPFYNLPFVNSSLNDYKGDPEACDVPATGGYFGGYETGKAMALAYLKCERFHGQPGVHYWLTKIVKSFMIRFEQEGGIDAIRKDHASKECENDGFSALRGQHAGFFNTISDLVVLAAISDLGVSLDELDERALVADANRGLQFDSKAYMDSLKGDSEKET